MLSERLDTRKKFEPSLRFSNLGESCGRKLWYSLNTPSDAARLPPSAKMKFLFGDILEHLLLYLSVEAGHTVEGMQSELYIDGIRGRRDAVIDGMLVDVKSASSYSYQKFKNGLKKEEDDFGYLVQLGAYLHASQDDPLVTIKDKAAFLVIDKQLGHICLDVHNRSNLDYETLVKTKKELVSQKETPQRAFTDEPDGKSGNMKLPMKCSYCDFKEKCWPNLRTFVYSNGPRFLTRVERLPDVPEAKG